MKVGEFVKRKIPQEILKEPEDPLELIEYDFLFDEGFETFKSHYTYNHLKSHLTYGYEDRATAKENLDQEAWLFFKAISLRFDKGAISKRPDSPLLVYEKYSQEYFECLYSLFFKWAKAQILFLIKDQKKTKREEMKKYHVNEEIDEDISAIYNKEGNVSDFSKKDSGQNLITDILKEGGDIDPRILVLISKSGKGSSLYKYLVLKSFCGFSDLDLADEFGQEAVFLKKKYTSLIKNS